MPDSFQKPNAALQARGAAEATQERRLFPVACKRWLGSEGSVGRGDSLSFEPSPSLIPPHGVSPHAVPLPSST